MVSTADVRVLSSNDRIAAWERRTRWVIVVAALAPFISRLLPRPTYEVNLVVDSVTWVVFVVDLVVHVRISRSYLKGPRGLFDLAIVVLTFPWYIFPAVSGTQFMMVVRWARLARLLFSGETGRRFAAAIRRLGTLGIALAVTSLFAALVVLRNEPADAGFEDFGDALWWSLVSFTTVGYGDLYPTTPEGRFAGAVMMFMGLVALGTVSGVLASTFVQDDEAARDAEAEPVDQVLDQLHALRAQVEQLTRQVAAQSGSPVAVPDEDLSAPTDPPEGDATGS